MSTTPDSAATQTFMVVDPIRDDTDPQELGGDGTADEMRLGLPATSNRS